MYMNIQPALSNNRLCKSLTGLSIEEFKDLTRDFEIYLQEAKKLRRKEWKRKMGAGPKGKLPEAKDKLFLILFYLKCYPTYDLLSFLVGFDRSRSCRWVTFLLPVLEKTLKRKFVLPKRRISSFDEFITLFPEAKDVFIDGTERRIQKPVSQKRRKKLYSGKKKGTTRKNIIVANERKEIIVLSQTKSGRRHDKKLADKMGLENAPPQVTFWTDTGLLGIQKYHPNTQMPKKRVKGQPLTEKEREENRLISSIRVLGEHAIAGVKRMRSTTDVYRNRIPNMDDSFMLLSSGLWNFHLNYSS